MNYYSHHIGDFIRDTARLPDSQCMAYLRLIWMYYETESPIQNDVDAIAFKIGASASDVRLILAHFFFLHDDNLWHQARCDKEILAFRAKSKKCKESANARWSNANAMRSHNERKAIEPFFDANQEPITNNQNNNPLTPLAGGRTPKPSKPLGKFPEALDTPAFRETWQKWLKFRTEKRKSLTPLTAFAQLAALEKVGVTLAIETIETSIRNGWQGLFPEKQSQQSQATRSGRQAMSYATAEDFNTPKDERGLPLSLGLSGPVEPVENADSEPFDY